MSGAFVAVVVASGSGKDSVIGAARDLLADQDEGFVFPRRLITRPVGAGEDHLPVSEADFTRIESEGGFALSWRGTASPTGCPPQSSTPSGLVMWWWRTSPGEC